MSECDVTLELYRTYVYYYIMVHGCMVTSCHINNFTGGVDYNSGPYTVIFPAGDTNVTLNISIIDDEISEGNEYFNLTIDSSSLPSKIGINDAAQVVVTIVDDEGK